MTPVAIAMFSFILLDGFDWDSGIPRACMTR